MPDKTRQTVIEISADYIYLVIIGTKENLKEFSKKIKKYCKDDNKKFIVTRLDIPISFKYNIDNIDIGTESAQSYAFAQEQFIFPKKNKKFKEHDTDANYMLMMVDNNILRFPKIDLLEEDPEKIIHDWMKKNYGSVPDGIKNTVKPLSLVGYDNDILVYSAKI